MIAPSIGSTAWDAELVEVGVSRAAVEALVARTLGGREPSELTAEELRACSVDPQDAIAFPSADEHCRRFREEVRAAGVTLGAKGQLDAATELVLTAAAELLLDQRCPRGGEERWLLAGYGLRDVPFEEPKAWRWYGRQLAAMAIAMAGEDESEEEDEDESEDEPLARLSLDLQYSPSLERTAIADALFPHLAEALPEALQLWLVRAMPSVSWPVKRAQCERLMPAVFAARPAPPIESAEWEAELALLGVSAEEVRAYREDVFGQAEGAGVYNLDVFHSFDEVRHRDGGQLSQLLSRRDGWRRFGNDDDAQARHVLQTAVIFSAFWRHPQTVELDYLRVCGWALNGEPRPYLPVVRRWMSRQIAACLAMAWSEDDGVATWAEHVQDQFFGFTDLDPVLFPWLVEDVPVALHAALLRGSSTVAWAGKRAFYARWAGAGADGEAAAAHAQLGEALASSCHSGVFHSIDAREGLALLEQLSGLEPSRREEIRAMLTTPRAAQVMAVAEPAESRFRSDHPGRCFVALAFAGAWPMWLMDADLWSAGESYGALASWYHGLWPEGPTTGREGLQRDGASQPVPVNRRRDADAEHAAMAGAASSGSAASADKKLAWHTVDVPYERAQALVGRVVEFRPRLG